MHVHAKPIPMPQVQTTRPAKAPAKSDVIDADLIARIDGDDRSNSGRWRRDQARGKHQTPPRSRSALTAALSSLNAFDLEASDQNDETIPAAPVESENDELFDLRPRGSF